MRRSRRQREFAETSIDRVRNRVVLDVGNRRFAGQVRRDERAADILTEGCGPVGEVLERGATGEERREHQDAIIGYATAAIPGRDGGADLRMNG